MSSTIVNKKRMTAIHLGVAILIILISLCYRTTLNMVDIEPLISILQNTSAMIFTIMGIWIAFVYPNAILSIIQKQNVESIFSDDDERRIILMVGVVAVSALVMCCLLIGTAITPFIIHGFIYKNYPEAVHFLGIFFILLLTYVQLLAIYVVIASNVDFIMNIRNLRNKRRLHERFNRKLETDEESPNKD
ncbi:hypothetical protein ACTG24_14925 [Aeromonas veronii]